MLDQPRYIASTSLMLYETYLTLSDPRSSKLIKTQTLNISEERMEKQLNFIKHGLKKSIIKG